MKFNPAQEAAIALAKNSTFSIINGGAGTGKTTIIKEIYNHYAPDCYLATPTGKSAARLREASSLPASTVHALMGFDGTALNRKLSGTLIIDEASMVDSWLMSEIIANLTGRLVLVGDEAQLPPVGKGQPFHDLVKLRPEKVVTLDVCYRAKEAVFAAALDIRAGRQPVSSQVQGEERWDVSKATSETAVANLARAFKEGKYDPEQDIILCCKNDLAGKVNDALLAARSNRENVGNSKWAVGDRIICTKNFSAADTWNGTTGTITAVEPDGVWVRGDIPFMAGAGLESEIRWDREILNECQHAYGLTVHKSQGSQYRWVVFIVAPGDDYMISQSLVYTAVTRAQKRATVIGDTRTFRSAVARKVNKNTVLQRLAARAAQ